MLPAGPEFHANLDVVFDNQLHGFLLKGITAGQLDNAAIEVGGHSKGSQDLFVISTGTIHHFETVESVQEGGFTVNAVERSPVGKLFVCKIFKDLVQVVPLRTVGTAGCKDNRVRFR